MFCYVNCVIMLSSLVTCAKVFAAKQNPPHIVFVLADDLGWNDVSFHGSNQINTPNIDALAYDGIILNNHYSESLCTPSRSALLTGKYPIHTGTQHNVILEPEPWGLPLNEILLPERLNKLGYTSHAVGKWHLGYFKKAYTPTYRGFKSFYGFWNGYQDYYTHMVQATFASFEGFDMRRDLNPDWSSVGKYSTHLFTKEATDIISKHNNSVPLFLYLAHLAPHAGTYENPLQAPQEDINKFQSIKDKNRRKYAGMITNLDESVAEVFNALHKNNMLDNTIFVFISDNGAPTNGIHRNYGSNWPLKGEKATPWEGGIRTAAFVWSKLLTKRKTLPNQLMHISDWLPTLYEAAGGNTEDLGAIDGISMWESFLSNKNSPRKLVLHNIDDVTGYAAIRDTNFKYIKGSTFLGYLDYWSGSLSPSELHYNVDAVLNSTTASILSEINGDRLTPSLIASIRNISTVRCNFEKDMKPCKPFINSCLFHIVKDPCEQVNLNYKPNSKMRKFVQAKIDYFETSLEKFRESACKPMNVRSSKNANPALYNNTWVNWEDHQKII
ncbi:arylsulfatase B-like [Melanaphis sacchari]|uniref:Arylsulfatase B n=1 Tax=Melanaphis sacchari TaxID=742174 RepID=A0A2H8TM77_9HEMI|nr:arylsulfatase B-like [Melanaphis sacchari]